MTRTAPLAAATALADELLFPAAGQVDLTAELPTSHLDALADAGLYGAQGPADLGGIDDFQAVVEVLAGGCLATTFVWIQHHGAVRAVAAGPDELRRRWLRRLCTGDVRAAVAQAGVRPGPPVLRATRVAGGYRFAGEAPWVTGWGHVQVIHTAARTADDTLIWALVDAVAGPGLSVEPLHLVAVDASRTVLVRFNDLFVPDDRVTMRMPLAGWPARDMAGLRTNGSLSLGATGRCVRLLLPLAPEMATSLAAERDACRRRLDSVSAAEMPRARAAASELALRSAATLALAAGARGVLAGEPAQRLHREAAFLLVFGSRPAIRVELLRMVGRAPNP